MESAQTSLTKLTELLLAKVLAPDGKLLGHVFDLRCATGGEETQTQQGEELILNPPRCEVREIIYGRRGWLATIGLTRPTTQTIPWDALERIDEEGRLIVKREAIPQP